MSLIFKPKVEPSFVPQNFVKQLHQLEGLRARIIDQLLSHLTLSLCQKIQSVEVAQRPLEHGCLFDLVFNLVHKVKAREVCSLAKVQRLFRVERLALDKGHIGKCLLPVLDEDTVFSLSGLDLSV